MPLLNALGQQGAATNHHRDQPCRADEYACTYLSLVTNDITSRDRPAQETRPCCRRATWPGGCCCQPSLACVWLTSMSRLYTQFSLMKTDIASRDRPVQERAAHAAV